MRILKEFFTKVVKSKLENDTLYLTYLVSDSGKPMEESELDFGLFDGSLNPEGVDQSTSFFSLNFKHLFPILSKIYAHLWVYKTP